MHPCLPTTAHGQRDNAQCAQPFVMNSRLPQSKTRICSRDTKRVGPLAEQSPSGVHVLAQFYYFTSCVTSTGFPVTVTRTFGGKKRRKIVPLICLFEMYLNFNLTTFKLGRRRLSQGQQPLMTRTGHIGRNDGVESLGDSHPTASPEMFRLRNVFSKKQLTQSPGSNNARRTTVDFCNPHVASNFRSAATTASCSHKGRFPR